LNHSCSPDPAGVSVQRDWIGWLPECKQDAFDRHARELEARYQMLSVTLDDAIRLHNHGSEFQALQDISLVSALCGRLTLYLECMLGSLEARVKDDALIPNVAPLDPANFLRRQDKYLARKCCLLSRILLTQRSGFLFKSNVLREMVGYLGNDFYALAETLLAGTARAAHPKLWSCLDTGHFDLNTCLRETLIMLRCFLRVLPESQVLGFQDNIAARMAAPGAPDSAARITSSIFQHPTSA